MKNPQNENLEQNFEDNMISRYVYAVTKDLPMQSRKDIKDELKTLIYDMLEERTHGLSPTKKDIDMVLRELGNPKELANQYLDHKRYLIGPRLFPTYVMILKIVMIAVAFGLTLASFLGIYTSQKKELLDIFASYIATLIAGLASGFTWVTAIFAVFEWTGTNLDDKVLKDGMLDDWNLDNLPEIPSKKATIHWAAPIASIIFTILVAILFAFAPQLMGINRLDGVIISIPVFNLPVLQLVLPLFLTCFALGILREIMKLMEGRYTIRLAIAITVLDLISLIITIIIFSGYEIWNPNLTKEISKLYEFGSDTPFQSLWGNFTTLFVGIFIFAFILDGADAIYKGIKYGKNE